MASRRVTPTTSQRPIPPRTIRIVALPALGPFDLRHPYVEIVYLPIIGPSATILARRLGQLLAVHDGMMHLNLVGLSRELGLRANHLTDVAAPRLHRALDRLVHANIARWLDPATLGVRTALPAVSRADAERLPPAARTTHAQFSSHDSPPGVPP